MRDEEGMWLPEPPNKEECHLSPSHPSVNVSHQSNSPHTISGTPNMVLKGSRTSSELSGTLGNISFIFQYAFSPLNFFFLFLLLQNIVYQEDSCPLKAGVALNTTKLL